MPNGKEAAFRIQKKVVQIIGSQNIPLKVSAFTKCDAALRAEMASVEEIVSQRIGQLSTQSPNLIFHFHRELFGNSGREHMGVAKQHPGVSMPRNQSYFRQRQSCFEETTDRFMP